MENWTEIRTAFVLGKLGTVSAAADAMGVHRATVMRRVEALESQLGARLFQRHTKGYSPTELGSTLIEIAERSENSFRSLIAKARCQEGVLEGELVVSCPAMLDHLVFVALRAFNERNPSVTVHFRPSDELLKLECGDADVALTLGAPPQNPDYVVRPLGELSIGLFQSMLPQHASLCDEPPGKKRASALAGFVRCERQVYGAAVKRWIENNIDSDQIVLKSSTIQSANDAVLSGVGAGFLPYFLGYSVDWLFEVLPPQPDWKVPVWIVTHMDVHRTPKVQGFLTDLKELPVSTSIADRRSLFGLQVVAEISKRASLEVTKARPQFL